MKKILLFIATFMFCIGVNAAIDVSSLEFTLKPGDMPDKLYTTLSADGYMQLAITSNNTEFNNLNDVTKVNDLGNWYYKINNGSFVKIENPYAHNKIIIPIGDLIKTTSEVKVDLYFKAKTGDGISKTVSAEFLMLDPKTEANKFSFKDTTTGITVNTNEILGVPYGTEFKVKKITDSNIIKKIRYVNPTVYELSFEAFGKTYQYYREKYSFPINHDIIFPIDNSYKVNDAYDVKAQVINKTDFTTEHTFYNTNLDSTNGTFEISVSGSDIFHLNHYIVLSTSQEYNPDLDGVNPDVPTPETPETPTTPEEPKYYCKKVDDKYYDKSGNVVDEAAYRTSCTETLPENPHTGIAVPFVALFTILGSILLLKKYKNKNGLRKI